jgi:hypothetical protein
MKFVPPVSQIASTFCRKADHNAKFSVTFRALSELGEEVSGETREIAKASVK